MARHLLFGADIEPAFPLAVIAVSGGDGTTRHVIGGAVIDAAHPLAVHDASGGGGVTAHSALTGLSADDHPQYVLADGTRAMTGNLRAPTISVGGAPITGPLLSIPVAATASSNYGEISIGAGPFDGSTTGFFVGNSNGTHIAINADTGYLGRMIDAQIAGARMFGVGRGSQASSASATLNAIDFPAFTVTVTGSTNITTAGGFNYTHLGAPVYSAGTALTITNAATLAIEGAPSGAGAGPATITNALALWVQAGASRFDGRVISTVNGAASAPGLLVSGTPFSGGSGTTTLPLLYLNDSTATASTTLATTGTYLGVNGHGTPNLANFMVDGVSKVKITSVGFVGIGLTPAIPLDVQGAGVTQSGTANIVMSFTQEPSALRGLGFGYDTSGQIGTIYANTAGAASQIAFWTFNSGWAERARFGVGGQFTLTPGVVAGGVPAFKVTPAAHTAVVAEVIDNSFAAHTMTITGGYTTNRFSLFAQPTITAASGLTVTNAATLAIAGAPIAAGSAIITNAYALWSQGGALRFDGNTYTPQAGVLAYALATTGSGANNPATAAQNGWLQLEDATGKFWVPIWR